MKWRSGMRARWLAAGVVVAATTVTTLYAPAQSASAASFVPLNGAGSTWSYNAINDWITNVAQYGMRVNYQPVGSTSGRQEFAQGTTDWGASEIPYGVKDGNISDPAPTRGYAYMPDTAGGTTFMYNLKIGNTRVTNLRLSGATIAGIFTGVITRWNAQQIKNDNPGLTLPNLQIVPVVRSDGSGATAEFTQWMLATQPSAWNAYCAKVGRSPCTQTSAYPVLQNSAMLGQSGDLGVSGYVSQAQADGAIGYVEFSYALETGFPVAKVLNADGYYTEPTAGHVAVSLLKAKIVGCNPTCSNPTNNPLYLTQDLSQVYTDMDPRTYELSSYSYMILPTSGAAPMTAAKGYTLGAFGAYLLCQGQVPLDALGYSSLPINLVEAGFTQLQRIPGNQVPTQTSAQIQGCNNPTFSTNGTNTLAVNDPYPPACDKQGAAQCTTATGGATTPTPVNGNANGSSGGAGSGNGSGGTGTGTATGTGSAASAAAQGCNPDSGSCVIGAQAGGAQTVNGVAVSSPASLGDALRVALMVLAVVLLLGLILGPPLIAQASRRRRPSGGTGLPGSPGGLR
jgi:phosphate ABC transporter phosphate-binding protein